MSFVLILQFALNGHVHSVNTGRTYSSQQECSIAGQQAAGYVHLARGERYSFSCRSKWLSLSRRLAPTTLWRWASAGPGRFNAV